MCFPPQLRETLYEKINPAFTSSIEELAETWPTYKVKYLFQVFLRLKTSSLDDLQKKKKNLDKVLCMTVNVKRP